MPKKKTLKEDPCWKDMNALAAKKKTEKKFPIVSLKRKADYTSCLK